MNCPLHGGTTGELEQLLDDGARRARVLCDGGHYVEITASAKHSHLLARLQMMAYMASTTAGGLFVTYGEHIHMATRAARRLVH